MFKGQAVRYDQTKEVYKLSKDLFLFFFFFTGGKEML